MKKARKSQKAVKARADMGQRLFRRIDEIMAKWEDGVRHVLVASQYQDSSALRDTLPAFLADLSEALSPKSPKLRACADSGVCKEHGGQRSALPLYRHQDIILEYRILQKVIFEVLGREGRISESDRDTIHDSILLGISDAVTEYLRIQMDIRQHFMLTLTHDLRTPITAIRAGAQLMLRYPEKVENHARHAHRIIDSVDRVESMITDLLDASRVKMGERLSIEIEECDLNEVALRVIEELTTVHGDRFRLQTSGAVIGFWNRDALRRCIENLLINAVKYGYRETPILVGIDQSGERATLNVHNEGEPLKPEEMAALFHPFKQADKSNRSGHKGWGLGLTLVRGVADALGGKAIVKSAPGEGTTFTMDLPLDSRPFQQDST